MFYSRDDRKKLKKHVRFLFQCNRMSIRAPMSKEAPIRTTNQNSRPTKGYTYSQMNNQPGQQNSRTAKGIAEQSTRTAEHALRIAGLQNNLSGLQHRGAERHKNLSGRQHMEAAQGGQKLNRKTTFQDNSTGEENNITTYQDSSTCEQNSMTTYQDSITTYQDNSAGEQNSITILEQQYR